MSTHLNLKGSCLYLGGSVHRTVAIEIVPLCKVVILLCLNTGATTYTARHDFDSDSPAWSHRSAMSFFFASSFSIECEM